MHISLVIDDDGLLPLPVCDGAGRVEKEWPVAIAGSLFP